jgi:cell division protein FtsQ
MDKPYLNVLRYFHITLFITFLIVLGVSAYAVVHYLHRAARFEVQKLAVSGLRRVQENEVLSRARLEIGTNVFNVDLDEMRENVEELQWVRHALVQRVLPDQIVIKVIEREPTGLARLNGEVYLFDADAEILELDPGSSVSFPVLDGLRRDRVAENGRKVAIYRQVVGELGETELSEVRINDSGEVSVVSASDPMLVNLGADEFRDRWIKYLQLKSQIQQQYPQAVAVDLRFRNQVIVRMRDDETGEKVVWGTKRRAL